MSVEAIAWAFKTDAGDYAAKLLLLALANFADEDGVCWPSQRRLSAMTGISGRAIRDVAKRLEDRGLIAREARQRDDGGRTSDLYRLRPPAANAVGGVAETAGPPCAQPPGAPAASAGLTLFEPSEEPSDEPVRECAKAIWDESPKAARKRSSTGQLIRAIAAAKRRGSNLAVIRQAVAAYYEDPEVAKENHRYARGVHRVVADDYWETWASAVGVEHIGGGDMQQRQWRYWMEDWLKDPTKWRPERGPAPDEPRCKIPAEIMAEFNYKPPGRRSAS